MAKRAKEVLLDLGRSTIGAMNLGLPLLYTMETWWLAWTLPLWLIGTFAIVGIGAVAVVTDLIGFEREEGGRRTPLRRLAASMVELVVSSFVASIAVLLLFGVVEWGDPLREVVRHGLIQLVPLGLGAAVANIAFRSLDGEADTPSFQKEMATFGLGAAFFAFNAAPTEEMELIAAHAGWWRILLLIVASVAFTYVILYVIAFRGRAGRLAGMESVWLRLGETVAGYAIALLVSAFMLFGYGHFHGVPFAESVQTTVVLAFIAAFGGAAARVVV